MKIHFLVGLFFINAFFLFPKWAYSYDLYKGEAFSLKAGFWGQAWYQTVSSARDSNGDGRQESAIYDTLIRRSYFYAKAAIFKNKLILFGHLAGDRIDQDYLHDRPSLGLGSNLVIRDAWVTLNLFADAFKVQIGRMYVPFTRNYGTTSTKTLLNLDLNWAQGGIRGGIFYPSRVGRDDGVCVWGNILKKKLQYRFLVAKGIYDSHVNPQNHPRFSGRVAWAFWEPETTWFNQGTYLGKKKILTIGAGFDYEDGLILNGEKKDYWAYTVDIHYDQPLSKEGAATIEAAFIYLNNLAGSLKWTRCEKGGDASIFSLNGGYLLPFNILKIRIQPNLHFERIDPANEDGTNVFGGGINFFIKGHANKLSLDLTRVEQDKELIGMAQDHTIFTAQLAIGF